MTSLHRSRRLVPGSPLLVVLLALMLGLSSVLAYQAQDAARSELRSTERALRGYAAFAALELGRSAESLLADRMALTLARAADGADAAGLTAAARRELAWCRCPAAFRGAFTVETRDGRADVVAPDAPPAVREALAEVAADPAAGGEGAHGVHLRTVQAGRERVLLAYRVDERVDGGRTLAGLALEARAVAAPVFGEVVRTTPLLPAALRGGFSNETALSITVAAAAGEVVFSSPEAAARRREGSWMDAKVGWYRGDAVAASEVVDTLRGPFAGLTTRLAVHPEVAAGRVADDEGPRSRLPLLLTVFGLTLALFCVAVVQLRRQQELVRLRDDFVSGVSHELRTPLAQIRLFADLLESGRLESAEQRQRSVRIINEESRRLTYLVENILHFSRAGRGAARISAEPAEVAPLVREIVDAFAPLARPREVRFALALEEGVVARVDRDALRQVLLNLLDNAVKYGPRGQRVRVGMALAAFSVRLWVEDEGPGIPPDQRARVWEPYCRLERDAGSAQGGSGIGLAVVRDLVELHGGRAWVEDAPGGGARFVVELPGGMYAGPPGAVADAGIAPPGPEEASETAEMAEIEGTASGKPAEVAR